MSSPKAEIPVSPSIAIEITANFVNGHINDEQNKIVTAAFSDPINFKSTKSEKSFLNRLQELDVPNAVKERRDTYWTIGIPDNTSQETRKAIIQAVENYRLPSVQTPEQQLEDIAIENTHHSNVNPKQQIPPIRLINRSTAGAISYLQSLRDQERDEYLSDGDVDPYLPDRHFLVMFVENRQVFGAEFKTIDGVVQQIKSYIFDDKQFETDIEKIEKNSTPENLLSNLTSLWIIIVNDLFKAKGETEQANIPAVFTYNSTSFLINNSRISVIQSSFVSSPEDKFSLFPSINAKSYQWPDAKLFILKGINVKTRMLAGDADMIDYDVSSAFVGEAIIECKDKFKASLIRDGEKLPIHRTIFKSKEPIKFEINFDCFGSYKDCRDEFICKVDDNGIIQNIGSEKSAPLAKPES